MNGSDGETSLGETPVIGEFERVQQAAEQLRAALPDRPIRTAIVLGSALGGLADRCEEAVTVSYTSIAHMPRPTAEGHAGSFVAGRLAGLDVLLMSGRVHYYEGYSLADVTRPTRILAAYGIETFVLTNAAGGVDPSFRAGDLMVIEDHINLTGVNPLRGPNDDRLGPRFPDMTNLYDRELRALFDRAGERAGVELRHGVYAGLSGPSYETPAEVLMLAAMGAHAVGMSTVPEAIVARHAGMRVAGVSCIANAAAGYGGGLPLSHEDVMAESRKAAEAFGSVLEGFCAGLAGSGDGA